MIMLGRGLIAAALVAVADQLSKAAVLRYLGRPALGPCASHPAQPVTGFFDLVLTCNRGVSFGMFSRGVGTGSLVFTVAAAVIVTVLLFWLARVRSTLLASAIGMIIGGAIGNVVDRLRYGGVVDFLYFHAGSWYWPAFNLADSAICLGVAAMLFDGLLGRRAAAQAKGRGNWLS